MIGWRYAKYDIIEQSSNDGSKPPDPLILDFELASQLQSETAMGVQLPEKSPLLTAKAKHLAGCIEAPV